MKLSYFTIYELNIILFHLDLIPLLFQLIYFILYPVMHVIEFQKRGLPHVHMLIWLHPEDQPKNIDKIDDLVSAEIPDREQDPLAYEAVKNYMIHGPCGKDCPYSPCMVRGKCHRHFPKRYFNIY